MRYELEFREQILKEIEDVGNITLVCKKHGVIHLAAPAQKVEILLYPNVVNWEKVRSQNLRVTARVPLAAPVVLASPLKDQLEVSSGQTQLLSFEGSAGGIPEHSYGILELKDSDGQASQAEY